MKCNECFSNGVKSTVSIVRPPQLTVETLEYRVPAPIFEFYDEDDNYHQHDYEPRITNYKCSNGHKFQDNYYRKCPTCGKKFNKDIEPKELLN